MLSFKVREATAIAVGAFEPGANILVDEIVVGNAGGLSLPGGASLKLFDCENCVAACGKGLPWSDCALRRSLATSAPLALGGSPHSRGATELVGALPGTSCWP